MATKSLDNVWCSPRKKTKVLAQDVQLFADEVANSETPARQLRTGMREAVGPDQARQRPGLQITRLDMLSGRRRLTRH